MALRIVVATHLVRHPLEGHTWHHLQYLVGLLEIERLKAENDRPHADRGDSGVGVRAGSARR